MMSVRDEEGKEDARERTQEEEGGDREVDDEGGKEGNGKMTGYE